MNQILLGMSSQIEEWVDIPISKFTDRYKISSQGNVFSVINNRILSPTLGGDFYYVTLSNKGEKIKYQVHILVALTFLGKPPSDTHVTTHLDGNKRNNKVSNLMYVTRTESQLTNNKKDRKTRRIVQLDPDRNIVAIHRTSGDAGKVIGKSASTKAGKCNSGEFYKGSFWEYEDDGNPKIENCDGKEIPEFENYLATKDGKIYSKKNKIFLSLAKHADGYLAVALCKDGKQHQFYVHILIAKTYIPNPENKSQINHINFNRSDNRVENLEWATNIEKSQYSCGKKVAKIDLSGNIIKVFPSLTSASLDSNLSRTSIKSICDGKSISYKDFTWKLID